MFENFAFSYVESNIFCILVLALMIFVSMRGILRDERRMWFNYTLGAFMAYYAIDSVWSLLLSGVVARAQATTAIINYALLVLLSVIGYVWYGYSQIRIRSHRFDTKTKRIRSAVPVILISAGMLIAFVVSPDFWVSPAGNLNPLYYAFFVTVPLLYVIVASVSTLRAAGKEENSEFRGFFIVMGVLPLVIAVFGFLQVLVLEAPLFCFGTTFTLLYVYLWYVVERIATDELTGLSNRGQLRRHLMRMQSERTSHGMPFIFIIDVDLFKSINDEYGHPEGDRALIEIAHTLKAVAIEHDPRSFVGRYGGDEFVVIAELKDSNHAYHLRCEIKDAIGGIREARGLQYDLAVSVGCTHLEEDEDVRDVIARADDLMYADKRASQLTASTA